MRKRILAIVVLVLAVGSAVVAWRAERGSESADTTLTLFGNVEIREAQLAFNAAEHVDRILVDEGDRVRAGQVLARLHTEILAAQVDEATARLDAQRQVVARLEAGTRPEEIAKARAELKAAEAQAKAARDSYTRVESLLRKGLISPENAEQARSEADSAEARVEALRAALRLLEAGPREEDIAAARAELRAREAMLELARERLADAELRAPADGIVRRRILEPGDMAFPQTPALTLAFIDPVWVRAYLPEPMLGRVRPGMAAEIETDSFPGKRYRGWVGYVSPTAEFTPKTVQTPELRTRLVYSVRIFACNPAGELRLGMPATVHFDLAQPDPEAPADSERCRR